MEQSFGQSVNHELEQAHILSPQHLQSLKALQTPAMELSGAFEEVLAENPLITTENDEVEYDDENDFEDEYTLPDDIPVPILDENRLDHNEEMACVLEGDGILSDDDDSQKRREYMFNSVTKESSSLQDVLMEELNAEKCTPEVYKAAVEIINSLSDKGFFRSVPAEIAQSVPCPLKTVEDALRLVQSFDPPGIAARDLTECFLIQLERAGKKNARMTEFVTRHLDDLAHNNLPKIAKEMGVSLREVNDMINEFRLTCNPRPAAAFDSFSPEYCPVEVTIERAGKDSVCPKRELEQYLQIDGRYLEMLENDSKASSKRENGDEPQTVPDSPDDSLKQSSGDEFIVRPNRENEPRFLIPNRYMKMLDDPLTDKETRDYILKNLKSLMDIRKALADRESTIVRIARIIADQQHDFFDKGPEHLRPMTMRDVADRLGLHETTVSRAIANKYMATPAGTFKFRDFFTGGYQNTDGEDVSSSAVKEYIREAVKNENPAHPLSDQKIAEDLKKKGLDVARRTVAKYREELGIPSSQGRKQYT